MRTGSLYYCIFLGVISVLTTLDAFRLHGNGENVQKIDALPDMGVLQNLTEVNSTGNSQPLEGHVDKAFANSLRRNLTSLTRLRPGHTTESKSPRQFDLDGGGDDGPDADELANALKVTGSVFKELLLIPRLFRETMETIFTAIVGNRTMIINNNNNNNNNNNKQQPVTQKPQRQPQRKPVAAIKISPSENKRSQPKVKVTNFFSISADPGQNVNVASDDDSVRDDDDDAGAGAANNRRRGPITVVFGQSFQFGGGGGNEPAPISGYTNAAHDDEKSAVGVKSAHGGQNADPKIFKENAVNDQEHKQDSYDVYSILDQLRPFMQGFVEVDGR